MFHMQIKVRLSGPQEDVGQALSDISTVRGVRGVSTLGNQEYLIDGGEEALTVRRGVVKLLSPTIVTVLTPESDLVRPTETPPTKWRMAIEQ